MSHVHKVVQGDTLPVIYLTLRDAATGERNDPDSWAAIDVSAATAIVMYFRKVGSKTLLSTITVSTVTDGTDGRCYFTWPTGALAVDPGLYEGEIELTFGSDKQTIYELLKFKVREQL